MIYVGIDIASEKHDCCIVREDKKILSSFTFPNSAKGFALLLDELAKQAPSENIRVGLEATGIYGTNLAAFLRRNGIQITTLNPLLLKNNLKGTTLRKWSREALLTSAGPSSRLPSPLLLTVLHLAHTSAKN